MIGALVLDEGGAPLGDMNHVDRHFTTATLREGFVDVYNSVIPHTMD